MGNAIRNAWRFGTLRLAHADCSAASSAVDADPQRRRQALPSLDHLVEPARRRTPVPVCARQTGYGAATCASGHRRTGRDSAAAARRTPIGRCVQAARPATGRPHPTRLRTDPCGCGRCAVPWTSRCDDTCALARAVRAAAERWSRPSPHHLQAARTEIESHRQQVTGRRAAAAAEQRMPPERLLQRLELVEQSDRIQCPVDRVQSTLASSVEHATGQHALERRLRGPVRSPHTTASARFGAATSSTAGRSSRTAAPPDTARPTDDRRADLRSGRSRPTAARPSHFSVRPKPGHSCCRPARG